MNKLVSIVLFIILGPMNCNSQGKDFNDFLPQGYAIFQKYYGDLNKDGQEDCILIIKGTDKNNVVINRFEDKVDRNRRGIIILFNKKDKYQLAAKNYNCFSSENEDGGVYFAPDLWIEVIKGNVSIHYGHGRYGYWRYLFRYQESDFKLIGYDSSDNFGPRINSETSINFLTKKKLVRENTNADAEGGDEIFKETWTKINTDTLINLSEIKDFDALEVYNY